MRIWLPALLLLACVPAHAYPGQGVPNPRYPDGTGNDQVEDLNNAQLDRNYRGPVYYPGQPPPPARPMIRAVPPPPPPVYDPRRQP